MSDWKKIEDGAEKIILAWMYRLNLTVPEEMGRRQMIKDLTDSIDARLHSVREEAIRERDEEWLTKIGLIIDRHKDEHVCRFNDGEQDCDCYLEGLNRVKRQINFASLQPKEEKHD